ncbi:hypothetical protein JCM14036_31410 [Desulfotomaculum defluvii]
MVRLFRAWSVVDNFNGQDQVKFNWFVVGRQIPIGSYEELIENYDQNDQDAWCDQLLLNEFFTEAEIGELRHYLLNYHHLEVQVEEVFLPIRSGGLSYGLQLINGVNGFYSLADEADYSLSISVLGHFDNQEQDSSNLLSNEDLQKGLDFLKIVCNYLKVPWAEQKNLTTLLNKIYEETGFCVQQKNIKKAKRRVV